MSTLRLWLLAAVVVLAIVVASLTAGPDEWHATVRWTDARLARLEREAATCPVLTGDVVAGSARAGYEDAARLAGAIDGATTRRLREVAAGDALRPGERVAALVARVPAAARQQLRRAAHLAGSAFSAATFGRHDVDVPFVELLAVVDSLLVQVRHPGPYLAVGPDVNVAVHVAVDVVADLDVDSDGERLAVWLDVLAAGVDLAGVELPVVGAFGALIVERAVDVADDDWLRAMTRPQRRRLSAALSLADGAFATREAPAVMAVHFVRLLESGRELEPLDLGLVHRAQAWRHGFSLWQAGAARAQELAAAVRRFEREPTAAGWTARRARLDRLAVASERMPAPRHAPDDLGYLLDLETGRRTASAQLRLLRLAVAFHDGGELPELADPLGDGAFSIERENGRLRARSAAAECHRIATR